MHICLVYDCLFPWTVGGAERWYRALGERLVDQGHRVTYLTMCQWDQADQPAIPGIDVIAVAPQMALYHGARRRILPPLRFGAGVFWHLLRHGRRYDHVHTASFPFFSLLAAGLLQPLQRYSLLVDWHEVWSREYWRTYLGASGAIGWWVQKLCAKLPQRAFTFSRLHLDRLEAIGRTGTLLTGEYAGGDRENGPAAEPAVILFAGRLIPEKRAGLLIEAFALAHLDRPELRLRIVGNGPESAALAARVQSLGLGDAVELSGFVPTARLERWMAEATVICQPSEREGYGMVVVEAAVRGVPVVVVEGADNAAVELVEPGRNGLIAAPTARALAAALIAIAADPVVWRARSRQWYAENRARLALDASLAIVFGAIAEQAG